MNPPLAAEYRVGGGGGGLAMDKQKKTKEQVM